jgi:DNA-binding CsgD family transcriptional regulator
VLEQAAGIGEMADRLDRSRDERNEDALAHANVLHSRACLELASGQRQAGIDGLLAIGRWEAGLRMKNPTLYPWRSDAALALRLQGERERARGLVSEEIELARAFGAPRALGIALRAGAIVEDDEKMLREAVTVLEGSGGRLDYARALIELGAMKRRGGSASGARDPLRAGWELASRCGATRLAAHAHDELLASGARPRRAALSGVESLTASERRVATMARERTNREIAQILFVTEKTVETHLGHVYSKLGISSRKQLPDELTDLMTADAATTGASSPARPAA